MSDPITILIDRREKAPYTFSALRTPDVVTVATTLPTGDYSLPGLADVVAIERKSLADLHSTITASRRRFERELARLNAIDCGLVMVESRWEEVCFCRPTNSNLPPIAATRAIVAWGDRFSRIRWIFADGRRAAETETLRLLEVFASQLTQG